MPSPGFPPTPAPSTDIQGRDDPRGANCKSSFALPPPAMITTSSSTPSNDSVQSDSSYRPATPTLPAAKVPSRKQRRPSTNQRQMDAAAAADFSLPPPPTRSRKIIQMKPGLSHETKPTNPATVSAPNTRKANLASSGSQSKKQPTSTSVAGRRIARKTAHSLIERRRRSKMNEEFGVLKDMIPACQGQEMHKLAILQASIDYLRYLEQCVTGLKAANGNFAASMSNQPQVPAPRPRSSTHEDEDEDDEEDEKEDLEMEDPPSTTALPAIPPSLSGNTIHPTYDSSTTTSPALPPTPTQKDHGSSYSSYSSTSTTSSLPSPAFPPQSYQQNYQYAAQTLYGRPSYSLSTETSPAILPEGLKDADQEATAALLMLNMDRRNRGGERGGGRGMSVRDLLSA